MSGIFKECQENYTELDKVIEGKTRDITRGQSCEP